MSLPPPPPPFRRYLVPMGREKEQRRKGRWSLRAFVARGLRSHTLPRAKAVSDESLQASGTLSDSVPATPQSAAGAANASIEAVGAAAEAAALTAETLGSQALPAVWAGAASGLEGLEGKSLMVQVVQARRLRPADSNGLSDPYCVVKVGPVGGMLGMRCVRANLGTPCWPGRVALCTGLAALCRLRAKHPARPAAAGGRSQGQQQDCVEDA